jgi:hypothetical protein
VASERPLEGLALEGADAVRIELHGRPERVEVRGVSRIVERTEDGEHAGLSIRGPRGVTEVLFRVPAAPETVDGLADEEL